MENQKRLGYPRKDADGLLPGGAPDLEVFQLMTRLSDLNQWCALMARKDSGGAEAARLVQDARCLIVERLYPRAMAAPVDGVGAVLKDDPHTRLKEALVWCEAQARQIMTLTSSELLTGDELALANSMASDIVINAELALEDGGQ